METYAFVELITKVLRLLSKYFASKSYTYPELVASVSQLPVSILPCPVDHRSGISSGVTPQSDVTANARAQGRRTRLRLKFGFYIVNDHEIKKFGRKKTISGKEKQWLMQ